MRPQNAVSETMWDRALTSNDELLVPHIYLPDGLRDRGAKGINQP